MGMLSLVSVAHAMDRSGEEVGGVKNGEFLALLHACTFVLLCLADWALFTGRNVRMS